MNKLLEHGISEMFVDPVDPVLDDCLDYSETIKNPMDLTTVRQKLEADKYTTIQQWKTDVELIWSNAVIYNGADSIIGIIAAELSNLFIEMTQGLTDNPSNDWLTKLSHLCDELGSSLKAATLVNPNLTKKSPSIMAMTPTPSEPEETQLTYEEINQLGNDIKKIKNVRHVQQIFECLKSTEPQIVGDKTSLTVNLCDFSMSTLLTLRDEVDLIKRKSKNDG